MPCGVPSGESTLCRACQIDGIPGYMGYTGCIGVLVCPPLFTCALWSTLNLKGFKDHPRVTQSMQMSYAVLATFCGVNSLI